MTEDLTCVYCGAASLDAIGEKDGFAIAKCSVCGVRQTAPMPAPETIDAFYDEYHANVANLRKAKRKVAKWKGRLFPLLPFTRGRTYLDVGCNTGFTCEAARQYGFSASGIDLSRQAIEFAKENYPECEFDCAIAQDYARSGRSFDLVVCSEIVEHLPDLSGFAESLSALTKPGGLLYFTTPDAGWFRNDAKFLDWKEVCPPHHLAWYDKAQIKSLLERNGFKLLFRIPQPKPSMRLAARKL